MKFIPSALREPNNYSKSLIITATEQVTPDLIDGLYAPLLTAIKTGDFRTIVTLGDDIKAACKHSQAVADAVLAPLLKRLQETFSDGLAELEKRDFKAKTESDSPDDLIECSVSPFKRAVATTHGLLFEISTIFSRGLDIETSTDIQFKLALNGPHGTYVSMIVEFLDSKMSNSEKLIGHEQPMREALVGNLKQLGLDKVFKPEPGEPPALRVRDILNAVTDAYGLPRLSFKLVTHLEENQIAQFSAKDWEVTANQGVIEKVKELDANLTIAYALLHEARHTIQFPMILSICKELGIQTGTAKLDPIPAYAEECREDAKSLMLSKLHLEHTRLGRVDSDILVLSYNDTATKYVTYRNNYSERDANEFAAAILSDLTGLSIEEVKTQVKAQTDRVMEEHRKNLGATTVDSLLATVDSNIAQEVLNADAAFTDMTLRASGLKAEELAMLIEHDRSRGSQSDAPPDYDPSTNRYKGAEHTLVTLAAALTSRAQDEYSELITAIARKLKETMPGSIGARMVLDFFDQQEEETDFDILELEIIANANALVEKAGSNLRDSTSDPEKQKIANLFRLNLLNNPNLSDVALALDAQCKKEELNTDDLRLLLEFAEELLSTPFPGAINKRSFKKTFDLHRPKLTTNGFEKEVEAINAHFE